MDPWDCDWLTPWDDDWDPESGGWENLGTGSFPAAHDLEQALEDGLWMDRNGNLYEMHELADHHIAAIIRRDKQWPAGYEPLVELVRQEKERRDRTRKNKFFGEEQVI